MIFVHQKNHAVCNRRVPIDPRQRIVDKLRLPRSEPLGALANHAAEREEGGHCTCGSNERGQPLLTAVRVGLTAGRALSRGAFSLVVGLWHACAPRVCPFPPCCLPVAPRRWSRQWLLSRLSRLRLRYGGGQKKSGVFGVSSVLTHRLTRRLQHTNADTGTWLAMPLTRHSSQVTGWTSPRAAAIVQAIAAPRIGSR